MVTRLFFFSIKNHEGMWNKQGGVQEIAGDIQSYRGGYRVPPNILALCKSDLANSAAKPSLDLV